MKKKIFLKVKMSYSSEEYSGSYTSPNRDYSKEGNYYAGSQFGPKLPPTVPTMKHPVLMEQGNPFGYDALTHGQSGQGYYDVASAYGNSCNPKFYVGECPSNKYLRPFVPTVNNTVSANKSCSNNNQVISEGYAPSKDVIKNLGISFFFDKKCEHSRLAFNNLSQVYGNELSSLISMMDIAVDKNAQIMTNLGGFATPFFFSSKTGCSATGNWPLRDLLTALNCAPSSAATTSPPRENYHSPHVSKVKNLQLELFVMDGCVFCDKMKEMLEKHGVLDHVKVTKAMDARHRLQNVRGFPYMMSHVSQKSHTGYVDNLDTLLQQLE